MPWNLRGIFLNIRKKITLLFLLSCLSIVTLCLCFIPVALNWDIQAGQKDNSSLPIASSVLSKEFYTSLVISLSISIPLIIELITRPIMIPKSTLFDKVLFSNSIILLSLAIPDIVILFYVIPYRDLKILDFILRARLIIVIWSSFTIVLNYGGGVVLGQNKTLLCQVFVCSGRIIGNFRSHYVGFTYKALLYSGFTADALAFFVYTTLTYRWLTFVYNESKCKTQSADRYLCTVYVVATFVWCPGVLVTFYMNPNSVEWSTSDSTKLTVHTLLYTVYYVLILVFEGKVLTREMLMARVSLSIYLHFIGRINQ